MEKFITYEEKFKDKFEPEIMEIAAVIGIHGASSGSQNFFCMLIAWQDLSNGEIYEEDILMMEMGKGAKELVKSLKKKTIVTLKVQKNREGCEKQFRVLEQIPNGKSFPGLEKILKKHIKMQKQKRKEDLLKEKSLKKNPVFYEDKVLGKFIMNGTLSGFVAEIAWCGNEVMLSLHEKEIQNSIAFARELFGNQNEWDKRIRTFAAEDLTASANDWNDDHEISEKEFYDRISIELIMVADDGGFVFWLSDDDMFRDHTIEVCGNMKDGPTGSDIVG